MVALLFAGLASACGGDGPSEPEALKDLQFEAMLVDSTDNYALRLTITNMGQSAVNLYGGACGIFARVQESPGATPIVPGVSPEGDHYSFICDLEDVIDYDLAPGETWTDPEILIPPFSSLITKLASEPHWYSVGVGIQIEGLDPRHLPHYVDIGWAQLTLPEGDSN